MADVDLTQNRQSELQATSIAITLLAVFFVVLRFLSRRMKGIGIGVDDIMILVALFALFAAFSACMIRIHYGMGKHAAALTTPEIVSYAKSLIAFECLYVTCICLTKISLLLMYLRIFPVRSIKIGAYILGALSISWCIAIIMVSIFQCTPIERTWNPTIPGHCINLKASFIGNAIPNILTDVVILALPIVIFTSIYRFTTLFQFQPADITWTLATAEVCSQAHTPGPSANIVTIGGGGGGKSSNSKSMNNGTYDDAKPKTKGSRPFRRLSGVSAMSGLTEEQQNEWEQHSNMKSSVRAHDVESMGSDEIPLRKIEVRHGLSSNYKTKDPVLIDVKFRELRDNFPKPEPYVLTHCDLNLTNIIVKDDQIEAIIDWEYSGYYPWWVERWMCWKSPRAETEELFSPIWGEIGTSDESFAKEVFYPVDAVVSAWHQGIGYPHIEHPGHAKRWLRPGFCEGQPYAGCFQWDRIGGKVDHQVRDQSTSPATAIREFFD
ncbi:hypothetical protein IFR05_003925 [Cadophora sp. M221]|nr:hypothetical protein IFR05_003925 [Cadophora sp. M221]